MKKKLIIPILFLAFNSFCQNEVNINNILNQLKLTEANCKMEFVVSKVKPNNPEETIVVIPEFVTNEEDYFDLNSYILVVETKTSKIKQQYFESATTNNWYSDAVRLYEISIDTAPYLISDDKRAFGIKVIYSGSSQPNPYNYSTISLFIEDKNTLKPILKDFTFELYTGEWDTNCVGEFTDESSLLIISKNKTNNFYNIIVKSTVKNITSFLNKEDKCDEKVFTSKKSKTLTYKNGLYQ